MKRFLAAVLGVLAAGAAYLLLWPVPIEPQAWTPPSPAIWWSHSNGAFSASSAASVASTISGPIPSPGIRVAGIFAVMAVGFGAAFVEEVP